jgi:hypothetical protein
MSGHILSQSFIRIIEISNRSIDYCPFTFPHPGSTMTSIHAPVPPHLILGSVGNRNAASKRLISASELRRSAEIAKAWTKCFTN